ncbi:alpha/beta hydrolase [Bradyrhizobium sp. LHD-71]|uniref:alpha/beta fold hydrolase n=1 Tax=Bradyrhizobium sp. LHD-71 TaxID=3072141 RepID=UPI00280D99EB|nr:alpha/beta hydrolase [Bradyrhizobium sp. LHD-71]MDQ8726567.1 alpha/beta hydrolase [Bradyrhizobium sp. LHD-71]
MPFATVNGIRLFWESVGEGMPLLFIHGGYGGAPTTLAPQNHPMKAILPRDKVQTILYDRRNAGLSDYTDAHYTLATLADDALGVLDHLGLGRAVIVGTSAGGPIALEIALSRPERVIALCLPNTGANLASLERPQGKTRLELVQRSRSEGDRTVFEARKQSLRVSAASDSNDAAEIARQAKLAAALRTVSDDDLYRYSVGEIRNYEAYLGVDCTPRLAELKMPVCIIHGTADRVVPYAWGEALHKAIMQSEMYPIPDADHGILAYDGAAVALRDWVGRVASGA